LFASPIAEVAQALYFSTLCTFINKLKAFIASTILLMFSSEISPTVNASCPKRMGTRTNELLLNCVGLPACSTIFVTNKRMALEPISIAAYFLIEIIIEFFRRLLLIYFDNIYTILLVL